MKKIYPDLNGLLIKEPKTVSSWYFKIWNDFWHFFHCLFYIKMWEISNLKVRNKKRFIRMSIWRTYHHLLKKTYLYDLLLITYLIKRGRGLSICNHFSWKVVLQPGLIVHINPSLFLSPTRKKNPSLQNRFSRSTFLEKRLQIKRLIVYGGKHWIFQVICVKWLVK